MSIALDDARYISFATFRKNGKQVNTPVWFAAKDGKYYLFSAGRAGKVKRLRNSSRAKVAPCDVKGTILGDWIDAEAFLVTSKAEQDHAYAYLGEKYGVQMTITNFFSRLTRRISKRAVISFTLNRQQ